MIDNYFNINPVVNHARAGESAPATSYPGELALSLERLDQAVSLPPTTLKQESQLLRLRTRESWRSPSSDLIKLSPSLERWYRGHPLPLPQSPILRPREGPQVISKDSVTKSPVAPSSVEIKYTNGLYCLTYSIVPTD